MKKRLAILLLCVLALFITNILFGSVHIGIADMLNGETNRFIVLDYRLPQALTALFAGAGLAVCGLLLQTLFHNPLAGPSVLGISGGSALAVAIVTLIPSFSIFHFPFSIITAAALGALLVTALLLGVSNRVRNNFVLLIIGLLLGYLISSLITVLDVVATSENLQHFTLWGMGDFSSVGWERMPVLGGGVTVLLAVAILLIKPLNLLQLGDQYAQNLGVNLKRLRNILLLVVGLLTAIITACCGPVAFIGLAVPHVARFIFRTDNMQIIMPATIVTGSAVALLCNQVWFLPINAVTPIVGIPVILYIVISRPS